jgi:hypothetical protein
MPFVLNVSAIRDLVSRKDSAIAPGDQKQSKGGAIVLQNTGRN